MSSVKFTCKNPTALYIPDYEGPDMTVLIHIISFTKNDINDIKN